MSVHADVERPFRSAARVSIHYDRTDSRIRLRGDGRNLSRSSELASFLPVAVMHPDSHRLIDADPQHRRRFLDWGVFHVEHHYLDAWRRYQRALRQRNRSLRDGRSDPTLWNAELARSGEAIDRMRTEYLEEFGPRFASTAHDLLDIDEAIVLNYRRGWSDERSLAEILDGSTDRDRRLGYTYAGPHRSDLQFLVDGVPIQDYVSRGQQKLLLLALVVAQVETYRHLTTTRCLFLVDDFGAELDDARQRVAMDVLRRTGSQVVLTMLEDPARIERLCEVGDRLFHVEQGRLSAGVGS